MAKLPINTFLRERLNEYDPSFELRSGTGFESLFFKPIEFIVQPLRDEANESFIGQSFLRILLTDDPDSFNEDSVDALASNLFVFRREGGFSGGTARVYFNDPVDREYPAGGAVFTGSNGKTYSNPGPFIITASEMSVQIEEGLYYYDIPVQSDESGADTVLEVGELVSLADDTDVVRVTNPLKFEGGLDREKNVDFINRIQNSIGVRDLVTGKGFNAILFENFASTLVEVQPIGFGDAEMMRDIVYNTHIGGRVDGYARTPVISQGSKDFVGILIDPTRQSGTSANTLLSGVAWSSIGNPNVDRSNGKNPTVTEIKISLPGEYTSPVDMSTPLNLATTQHVQIGVDGVFKNVRVAGVIPGATTRNEIVNLINAAFGINIAFTQGNSVKVKSPTTGLASQIVITNPTVGNSAIFNVFGLSIGTAPHVFDGDGPVTFVEGTHYEMDDELGQIRRVLGATVLITQTTGETNAGSDAFTDPTPNIFLNIQLRDIITIQTGADAGDYRVLEKPNNNTLILDKLLTATATGVSYSISRTGIKDEEVVYVQYHYNPLSIDIGKNIVLDDLGRVRGIRPGREAFTITDLPVLRINRIEEIDPLTFEPTGVVLDGSGGWGQGGWGRGGYGSGQGTDWRLIVNLPTERFSMFEDSYIILRGGLQGLSFRVHYDYVPVIEEYHNFVRSETERVLDGDILMKHFLPAYVSGKIEYRVDSTDSTVPDNDTLTTMVKAYINAINLGKPVEYSDIIQFIVRSTDPFDRYGTFVRPFQLRAVIHNTDGSLLSVTGQDQLDIPTLNPFPKFTTRPISPKICRWVADEIELVRL